MKEYIGKKTVVVGLARTGVAVARFLLERGAAVCLTDQQPANRLGSAVKQLRDLPGAITSRLTTELGFHRTETFTKADLIVLSPGVPLDQEQVKAAREAGVEVISEVELAYRHLKGKIIGVTGTNGKTTTTMLIGHVLRHNGYKTLVAGNIGDPLIGFVDQAEEDSWLVTELSSFQLEAIKDFHCHIAVLLNITPDHLDRHGSLENYVEAKARIFHNQTLDDWAVLNATDPCVQPIMRHLVSNVIAKPIYFGTKPYQGNGFLLDGEWISYRREGKVIPMVQKSKIPLKGNHNLENVMAALAVSLIRMLDPGKVVEALCSFQAPEHRLEWCGNLRGIDVYNDSKATNIDACAKAVEAFDSPVVLIMGGRNKGMDFDQLRSSLEGRVKKILAIGESATEIQEVLGGSIPVEICDSMPSAVEQGFCIGTPGDVLLLAPACASYDMFEDYKERGRIFKEEVAKRKGVLESAS